MRADLREAWTSWLGQRPWDLFLTLTSKERTHPEALHKRFRYCVHILGDELYGRRRSREDSPIEYVNGIERHKSGWPHSHALLRVPEVDLRDPAIFSLKEWQETWTDTGGFVWLAVPRNQEDVVSYVTKYVIKDGDLVLSENLEPGAPSRPSLPLRAPPRLQ